MMTTQKQVRAAFWQGWQGRAKPKRLSDGDCPTDIRCEGRTIYYAFIKLEKTGLA